MICINPTDIIKDHSLNTFTITLSAVVVGDSMRPTLKEGQQVFIDRRKPIAGDIVVFKNPATKQLSIKRLIATGGQTVSIRGGVVSVDGVKIEAQPNSNLSVTETHPETGKKWVIFSDGRSLAEMIIGDEHVFVVGDNRGTSLDSRHYGPVSADWIIGVVDIDSPKASPVKPITTYH